MARLTASTDTHDGGTSTSTTSSAASCTAAQQDTQARHAYAAGKLDQHLAVAAGQGPATAADSEQQGDAYSTILMASAVQGPGASALGAAQQAGPQPSEHLFARIFD